jgi:hypothetical protein
LGIVDDDQQWDFLSCVTEEAQRGQADQKSVGRAQ